MNDEPKHGLSIKFKFKFEYRIRIQLITGKEVRKYLSLITYVVNERSLHILT